MTRPNFKRAYKAYTLIQTTEGIGLNELTRQLGLKNIGDVRSTLLVLGNRALLSEDTAGGLYIFGMWGLREPEAVTPVLEGFI